MWPKIASHYIRLRCVGIFARTAVDMHEGRWQPIRAHDWPWGGGSKQVCRFNLCCLHLQISHISFRSRAAPLLTCRLHCCSFVSEVPCALSVRLYECMCACVLTDEGGCCWSLCRCLARIPCSSFCVFLTLVAALVSFVGSLLVAFYRTRVIIEQPEM
jgi:hypothetical protein